MHPGAGATELPDQRTIRRIQLRIWYAVEQSGGGTGDIWKELYGVECPFYQADGLLADCCRYAQEDSGALYRGDWTGSWFSRGPHGAVAV